MDKQEIYNALSSLWLAIQETKAERKLNEYHLLYVATQYGKSKNVKLEHFHKISEMKLGDIVKELGYV